MESRIRSSLLASLAADGAGLVEEANVVELKSSVPSLLVDSDEKDSLEVELFLSSDKLVTVVVSSFSPSHKQSTKALTTSVAPRIRLSRLLAFSKESRSVLIACAVSQVRSEVLRSSEPDPEEEDDEEEEEDDDVLFLECSCRTLTKVLYSILADDLRILLSSITSL